MRLSLSRKIILIFSVLISFSLAAGVVLYLSLHRVQRSNSEIHRVHDFQMAIHLLEGVLLSPATDLTAARQQFELEFRRAKDILGQLTSLEADLEGESQAYLREAGEYLDNYRQAFLELGDHYARARSLHGRAMGLYNEVEVRLSRQPGESEVLFPLLLDFYAVVEEVLDDNDVTLIPELKKLGAEIRALEGVPELDVPLRGLISIAEESYLNSLARQERADFLTKTADHFYGFTDAILQGLDRRAVRLQERLSALMYGLLAAAVLAGLLLFWAARNYFAAFLHQQRAAIKAIEEGRYDYSLPPALPADELGDLARFTKSMAESLGRSAGEVRASQERLRASEEHVRLILNSAAEAIYGVDREGRCTFCNRSMLTLLGYERDEELLSRNIHDLIHHHRPDGRPYPWDECLSHTSFREGRETYSDDEVFFRRDGTSFPAECWSHPIQSGGEYVGAVVTFLDISKRKAAQQALKSSEELYRSLVENIDLGISLIDKDHTIVMANRAQGRLLGRAVESFRGRKCFREFEKRKGICSHCPGVAAMATGKVQEAMAVGARDDGTPVHVRIKAFPVFAEGETPSGFIEVVEDISEKLKTEQDLAAEKERLAVTLRSIGDGVIATDTAGRIVLINKVAEELCGWPLAEAAGRPLPEVFRIVNETTGRPCENPVEKALATGQTVSLANHTVLIARDGTRRSIADSGAPIRDRESRIIGVVLVFRDVTEQQRMETELLKARRLESIGVLAGGIAHDFNNILAAILGNINLVRHIIAPGEKRAHIFLEEAEKASLRARGLTQQLLTFSRGGEPVRTAASMTEIIKDSTAFVLRGSGIRYEYDLPAELWPVDADPGQISQVMQNLVLNARHAMPGGGTVRVSCRNVVPGEALPPLLSRDHRYVQVDIADTGVGIPASIIDNIFDPYFSTKKEGSGLGLSICHSIISKHGGSITVRSEQGQGSVFTFYLPAAALEPVPELHEAHREKALAPLDMTVLIMDDDAQVRDIAAAMLGHLGCKALLAEDGEQALALYQEGLDSGLPARVVIMDLTIPGGMGGREAVTKLLAIDPGARVLVSSGYSNDPILANFAQYGFCGAIVKPYQLKELASALRAAATG